ncbi:MAG: hypothetical protein ABI724_04195 [Betaproteobacteria bacterium]
MDRSTTMSGTTPLGGNNGGLSQSATNPKVESAAQTAHQTVDKVAEKVNAQVDRLSGTAHRMVSGTAEAASSAAEIASSLPEQAKDVQAKFTETASSTIRARPLSTIAGAVVVGYLLGRLARI